NFDLKSQKEQDLILHAFQAFLNTLDFSVQIFIHSRKVNIESYLAAMEERRLEEANELLKIQIADYMEFIRSFVADNPIITKSFFIVVPYDAPALSVGASYGIFKMFKKSAPTSKETDERVERQKKMFQLEQRVDEVITGLAGMGVPAHPLENEEITELFYNLYNPGLTEKENFAIAQQSTNNESDANKRINE
ncbi:MAG: hypothetical protein AAB634_01900, partial [Patescibacteria group bacterium]